MCAPPPPGPSAMAKLEADDVEPEGWGDDADLMLDEGTRTRRPVTLHYLVYSGYSK